MDVTFLLLITILHLASIPLAEAQQPGKLPKVGWLSAVSGLNRGQQEILRMLHDFGYIDGKNVAFEFATHRTSSTAFSHWLRSWSVSRLTYSLHQGLPGV
jgi:hypothetical protein